MYKEIILELQKARRALLEEEIGLAIDILLELEKALELELDLE